MKINQTLLHWYQEALPIDLKAIFQLEEWQLEPELIQGGTTLPDGFSRLRHQCWKLRQHPGRKNFADTSLWEIQEKSVLMSGETLDRLNPVQREELLECMMLSAAIDSADHEAMVILAETLTSREFTRPLMRQLFRKLDSFHCQKCLRRRLSVILETRVSDDALRLTLELWAEHPGERMTASFQHRLMERCYPSEKLLRALLQCAGNNRHDECLMADWLQETSFSDCSPRLQQAMMDYCAKIATPRILGLLVEWENELRERRLVEDWIPEYACLCLTECRQRLAHSSDGALGSGKEPVKQEVDGMVLAQFMFYGDLMLPGKANSGGIATLLRTLGDALVGYQPVAHAYTFMMMPCDERAAASPLTTSLAPHHTLVRVPVFYDEVCSPELFREKEYDIHHSLERMMDLLAIDPDIYHMRYSDNASLAAALLAQKRDRKAVFTLTPDPHRTIRTVEERPVSQHGRRFPMQTDETDHLLSQLNKVRAADDIINCCQGILGIGSAEMAPPLLAYFPQLEATKGQETPLFQMIPEGIQLSFSIDERMSDTGHEKEQAAVDQPDFRQRFTEPTGKYRLSPERLHLPVILTVGRLDPVKGQVRLLEAWGDSPLAENFNLVFIGGDHVRPDGKEKAILEKIDALMEKNASLCGGFCHLERMDNDALRRLQESMAAEPPAERPHLYVSPSLKEEFGLSIIEAMAAGLVVIGPKTGGVGSYVTSGENGFLVDTRDTACLQKGLITILLDPGRTTEEWQAIAARGKETVYERFDIRVIAGAFVRFYQQIVNRFEPRGETGHD
ncbi:MAG: glycosyltransferase family 4 protein [Bacillota bacterium]|nr:glycosyltransferase family 4 protein [Bacillota bacterium]MDW7676543.1 glycosyltransferase family 4 protein [Bacillota bacterium]